MKITKTSDRAAWLRNQKEIANRECKICPCCGTPYKGIPTVRSWAGGFFLTKSYEVQCYHCWECGAEWESDPYIWA